MAMNCSIGAQCNAPESQLPISRKAVRNILIGLVAAITVSYGEYRAIEQAPAFAAACLVALSSDFKRVVDATNDAPPKQVQLLY